MRTLIISMHPAPYRDSVYEELGKKLPIDVVFLYSGFLGHSEWGLKEANASIRYKKFPLLIRGGVDIHFGLKKLVQEYDTILIPGWYPISLLWLLVHCINKRKHIVFSCDTISCSNNVYHKFIFKYLKKCDAFFVPGRKSASFLENQVGIKPQKIFQGSYMIDETDWHNRVEQLYAARNQNRSGLGISEDDFVLLFVGKFVQNRDVPILLKSVEAARNINKCIRCIIIGDGAFYKKDVCETIKNDKEAIIYYEKVLYDELAMFYSIADCYIHPGDEPYSLATVQAVTAGLPVISHENVGCLADYVVDGNNGRILKEKNPSKFCNAILEVFTEKEKYSKNSDVACRYYLQERNVKFAVEQLGAALNYSE